MTLAEPDLTGKVLNDRYALLDLEHTELLGRVWAAEDRHQGARVSVKTLHPHLTTDTEKFKRFGREITNTWMIKQANTVDVTDWGQDGDIHFLVMEPLRSGTLAELLEEGPLGSDRALRIAAQIGRALAAAHQESIAHRALAPRNVLLLENSVDGDFVKVRDFGLSKLENEDDEQTGLTTQNTRVGDAEYMAPEYIQSGDYTPQGDLYALGALLYHMVAGRPPFIGKTLDVLQAHVAHVAAPLDQVKPDTPAWVQGLVADLLSKVPADRPSARATVQRIEDGLEDPVLAPELLPLGPNGEIVHPKKTPVAAIVLGGLLLLGAGMAIAGVLVVALAVLAFFLAG